MYVCIYIYIYIYIYIHTHKYVPRNDKKLHTMGSMAKTNYYNHTSVDASRMTNAVVKLFHKTPQKRVSQGGNAKG